MAAVGGCAVFGAGLVASAQTPPVVPGPPLAVVVTIKPIHALAAIVLGDVAKPELLLDGSASPHTYALKPSQVRRLHEAQAVVMVSDALETFMGKVTASLPKTVRTIKLDAAAGVVRWPIREGGLFAAHDHGHGHAGHTHGGPGAKAAARTGETRAAQQPAPLDAHLWLDPVNGRAMLAHLAEALGDLAPAHKDTFAANARAGIDRIDKLQAEIGRDLQPAATKPFLVFHDAYQYFERRFGLTSAGSITLNPESQPGARRLKALRTRIEEGGVVCVFAEPQFEPKLVATLIEGTKARKGTLDPIGAALPAGPGAYEALLRGLTSDLRACLAAPS